MDISNLPPGKQIILFDGVCNLCDSLVQYVIEHDKDDLFRFAPLQSETGAQILNHIGVDREKIDSIILYKPGIAYYVKSDAALEIARQLGWAVSSRILRVFPALVRNAVYDFIARNRYKWYGKKESCMIPTLGIMKKFL